MADWLSDWLNIPENIELLRKAGVSVSEVAIAQALGHFENDLQPKILDPLAATIRRELDGWVDRTIEKLKKLRIQ